jgi:RND superfamily putative drug exporter
VLRFLEDRRHFPDAHITEALDRVIATSGRTVLFSAITVALSLTGTFFFHAYYVYSMGLAIIFVVVIASFTSLTVLMAILARYDMLLFKWSTADFFRYVRVRLFPKYEERRRRESKVMTFDEKVKADWWYRSAMFSIRFAVPLCTVIIAGLVGLLYVFVSEASFGSFDAPHDTDYFRFVSKVEANFPEYGLGSLNVYLETKQVRGVWTEEFLVQLDQFATDIEELPDIASVGCIVRVNGNNITNYIQTYAPMTSNNNISPSNPIYALYDPYFLTDLNTITRVNIAMSILARDQNAPKVVSRVRHLLRNTFIDTTTGKSLLIEGGVTGDAAADYDLYQDIARELPNWLSVMVCSIYFLLFMMTASVVLPFKAIITALLSLCATLGVLVLVFQKGHGAKVLGFSPTGRIDGLQLIFVFSLAFGLSMDYELFILG